MSAPVRIEAAAWTDPRFALLAKRIGLPHALDALIRCALIWGFCTERSVQAVSPELLDAMVGIDGFGAAMVAAQLAEPCDEGLRIRGAAGRTEWLGQRRAAGKQGGVKRQANARQKRVEADQEGSNEQPSCSVSGSLSGSGFGPETNSIPIAAADSSAPAPAPESSGGSSSDDSLLSESELDERSARRGREWFIKAIGVTYQTTGKFRSQLIELDQKPDVEKATAWRTLKGDPNLPDVLRWIDPVHVLERWDTHYSKGRIPGRHVGGGAVTCSSDAAIARDAENNPPWARGAA